MDEKKYFFLGPVTPPCNDKFVIENSLVNASNAPNVFQWSLIKGMDRIVGDSLQVINVLPVGVFPKQYKKAILNENDWFCENISGHEIGCINIPFIKQYARYIKVKKYLREHTKCDSEIVIYSTYLPFLKAIMHLSNVKCTLIVTDLPEYYDLSNVGSIRKWLRHLQNKFIYKALKRIDRFVLLTKDMAVPLEVGDRPWMVMEGLYNTESTIEEERLLYSEPEEHIIFYSGTLNYQFGIKELVDSFLQIPEKNIKLWICGSGEAAEYITVKADNDKRITYFGFCSPSDVKKLRMKATILINPRSNEGEYTKYSFPSKTMEYMASGKPVIMYKLSGMPDDYFDYLNFISEGNPISCIKNQIMYVINNYERSLERACKGKEFIINKKNNFSQAEKLIEFLKCYI